ncbi:MAG: hypothetical protein LBC74_00350 [Planctomycetaceae bacterium]|jgi:hypothetical protein|nr:hypothetical protein [Planctomycetaceae bacterium]
MAEAIAGNISKKWTTLTGIFAPNNKVKTFRLFNGSTEIGFKGYENPDDPGPFAGTWYIGAHETPPGFGARLFK